jgi:hypothetical protein
LIAAYAVLSLALVDDYGITYDEYVHSTNGENALIWYSSGFTDQRFRTFSNLRYYGVLVDLPAVIVHRATGVDLYYVRHLFTSGFAILAVAGVAHLARRLNGPAAGFFAAWALILTPRFFGHGFNNTKDIPMAACTVWAVAWAITLAEGLPRPPRRAIVGFGVWLGLALAMRVTALTIGAIAGVACLMWWLTSAPRPALLGAVKRITTVLAAATAVAAVVAVPFWPYVQVSPIFGGARILRDQWQAGLGSIAVLFDGHTISHRQVPATYVWRWLVRITPEFYAAGLLIACGVAASRRPWTRTSLIGWTTVATAILLPLGLATLTRPAVYDGLRHFLFATVFIAVPVGAGFAWCVRRSGPPLMRSAGVALLVGSSALTVADMVRLHPYQSTWFNRSIAGGLAAAAGRWDTDYWGNALRESTRWLVDHVEPGSTRPRVASSASPPQVEHYLPADRFEYVGSVHETPALARDRYSNPPDYYVSFMRWGSDRIYPGQVLYRVERDGVPLAAVIKVDRVEALRRGVEMPDKAR